MRKDTGSDLSQPRHIGVYSAGNLLADIRFPGQTHRGFIHLFFPCGDAFTCTDIRVQKPAPWAQHTSHFLKKSRQMWVAVRGFDVDHDVEAPIGEWQVLRIALDEIQTRNVVPSSAELNPFRVQVKSCIRSWLHGTHQIRSASAMPATNLQHPLASDICLSGNSVIQLNEVPVRFIGFAQLQLQRRIFLVTPTEEQEIVAAKPGGDTVPVLRSDRAPVPSDKNFPVSREEFTERGAANTVFDAHRAKYRTHAAVKRRQSSPFSPGYAPDQAIPQSTCPRRHSPIASQCSVYLSRSP